MHPYHGTAAGHAKAGGGQGEEYEHAGLVGIKIDVLSQQRISGTQPWPSFRLLGGYAVAGRTEL